MKELTGRYRDPIHRWGGDHARDCEAPKDSGREREDQGKESRNARVDLRNEPNRQPDVHPEPNRQVRTHESLVIPLRLVVPCGLLPHLLLKVLLLNERIVQLGVGVAELARRDKALEPFAQSRHRAVTLGERGHDLRVADDEGRGDALVLDELADELEGVERVNRER